ncbi:helix-turn-helix transcriptional regulator [Erwinia aphidicola]|jgi:transcriptional regulator with XRE-family HTH domain|uniref:Helix-turn-helix transcriptional regulator n=1 Tax=Erwinia aphidicola TaxID=68334 RepID=A0ABU8DKI6_ERWAP|nr:MULTISPECIES: helix-turn-helix transcriptional regulator [Erwinia]KMV72657.1 DNA-binding protein [bacteria symbiont BFo1 of Frankliniella occidentalis]PIJ56190.1 transcriptional regulator [Erwinia sp. OLMDLW33]KYP86738.1 DNA-binding protein [bacteria symbiont BFo1 of Frankliniella occidentalis]KYP92081.1 DNA-binding protein [bacteria symbiont BFo1 of Frankliniella occidentalis]MBD1376187.1 helix-turn-helix transcriptional regulator [Erwinia aphidicola]
MLSHRLKEARLRKGISQQKLGVLAGIDEATSSARMNQYERGIHVPDFELVCRLASILNVPSCYFYTVEDELAELVRQWYLQQHPE